MAPSWLARVRHAEVDGRPGLLWPGRRADLHLSPACAVVSAGGHVRRLPWAEHRGPGEPGSGWRVATGDRRGLAVVLGPSGPAAGRVGRAAHPVPLVGHRRRTVWLDSRLRSPGCEPLAVAALLGALCSAVAVSQRLRTALVSPATARALARALEPGVSLPRLPPDDEVARALRGLGYVHLTGRPCPWEALDPPREVLARVQERLPGQDPAQLEREVRRRYLDVEPWPLDGLDDRFPSFW